MADSPDMIGLLATAVLDTVVAAYAAATIDLPDRRYTTSGAVAYDCEQVVVSLVRLYPGIAFLEDPSQPVLKATLLRSIQLAVHVVRCIPTLKDSPAGDVFPEPTELDASGQELLVDAYMLPTCIVRAWHDGDLSSYCSTLGVRELVPAEPDGGFGGSILSIDAQF